MENSVAVEKKESTKAGLCTNGDIDTAAFAYVGIIIFTYRIFTGFMQIFPQIAESGAVLNCIVSSVLMLVLVKITMSCMRYVGSINLFELCREYLGGFAHSVLGLIVVLFALISVSNAVIEFSEITKVIAFKTAPILFLIIFFVLIVFMAQRSSLNSSLGIFSVITPIILILFALVIITSLKYGDIKNLFPVLGGGTDSIAVRGIKTVSIYSDFILLLFTGSALEDRTQIERATKAVEISAVCGAAVNVLAVLIFTLCAAYPFSKDITNPLYHVIEIVYYGRFFQRIDGFYMLVSILAGMLYIAYTSKILINVTRELLKIQNTKPLSILYPIIIAVLSYAFSERYINERLNSYIVNYSYVIGLILPCVLTVIITLIYNSKQKKIKQKAEKSIKN